LEDLSRLVINMTYTNLFAKLAKRCVKIIHELLSTVVLRNVANIQLSLTLVVALKRLLGHFVVV
jgi:hypothetical protein